MLSCSLKNNFFLIIISSFFLTISFDNNWLAWLVFIAVIPVFYLVDCLDKYSFKKTFFYGYLFGAIYFAMLTYWEIYATIIGYVAIIFFEGLFLGVVFILTKFLRKYTKLPIAYIFAFVWLIYEYSVSFGKLGFPWGNLAYRLAHYRHIIQTVSFFGWFELSVFVMLINYLIYKALKVKNKRYLLFVLVVFIIQYAVSLFSANYYAIDSKNKQIAKVAVIQPNIQQFLKWDRKFVKKNFRMTIALIDSALKKNPDIKLVITPESVTAAYFRYQYDMQDLVNRILEKHKKLAILIGSPDIRGKYFKRKFFNSAFFIKYGEKYKIYDKIHLVPGGEYIPFADKVKFLQNIQLGQANFTSGTEIARFKNDKISLGVLICYETVFSDLVIRNSKSNNLLANISNDAWFKISSQSYQHSAFSLIRAIETRRTILRSANTGISFICLPNGEILEKLGLYKRGYMVANVPLNNEITFFVKYPHFTIFIMMLFSILLFVYYRMRFR